MILPATNLSANQCLNLPYLHTRVSIFPLASRLLQTFASNRMLPTSTTLSEDNANTLTQEKILRSTPSPLNRLRLKVKHLLFLKQRTSIREGQFSPNSPAGKFFDASGSSTASSPLSLSFFVDALKNSLRSGKRKTTQRSTVKPETPSPPFASPGPRDPTFNDSSPYDCKLRQSVIVKALPSVVEVPEPTKGWRKPRLPIPKWDIDD
ncbi:uncharacterized protein EDB91DRAFT_1254136 [Suillus paluster]|uniref:uncharacterized protein n=1 Tax=Suillus paluster TaxID=48578 RepID=UPI001B881232|nr:uncharacterized protein EDB91DRAFT_1254136 [Suillus paluster]KAG1726889.1 hypothetical protein EDB91DRAFT_1254136 [Suillus paluster]